MKRQMIDPNSLELNDKVVELKESADRLGKQLNSYGFFETSPGVWEENSSVACVIKRLKDKEADWIARNTAFKTELQTMLASLKEDTASATKTYKNVYTLHRNKVSMIESGYISTDKYIPDVIGLVGLAAVGFVITTLVTTGVYISKKDKKED